jgi:hypothetical protein
VRKYGIVLSERRAHRCSVHVLTATHAAQSFTVKSLYFTLQQHGTLLTATAPAADHCHRCCECATQSEVELAKDLEEMEPKQAIMRIRRASFTEMASPQVPDATTQPLRIQEYILHTLAHGVFSAFGYARHHYCSVQGTTILLLHAMV